MCALLLASLLAAGPPPLTIQAVGDLSLSGDAEATLRAEGYGTAFEGTRALLARGDLNIANLETPITLRGTAADKRFTFRMRPTAAGAIARAGISLVSLANNHTLDYGPEGLLDTLAALDANQIAHAGAGKDLAGARTPAIVLVKGVRVGMLSYSLTYPDTFWARADRGGTAFGHEAWVRADVAELRPRVDLVLVAFHWGQELMETPKGYQRALGHAAIEAGADAVIGTHPHVLQGIEIYRGKPILYSLGNYAFGSKSRKAGDSALVRLTFVGRSLERLEAIPLDVCNARVAFDPRPAKGAQKREIAEKLGRLSALLGTRTRLFDDSLVYAAAAQGASE